MPQPEQEKFSPHDGDTLYRIMRARRDMRHFVNDVQVDSEVLQRILQAAHTAPSVGLMQPWRFIRISDSSLRQQIADLVEVERQQTAEILDQRSQEFLNLKVEGIRECAELLAVVQAPDDGTVFGRRTMPEQMALCSTACAIQNLWLAARAENIGMGWVSLFDPTALASLLNCPDGAMPVALLCLGPVDEFYPEPMLQQAGWRDARPLKEMLGENTYGSIDMPEPA